MENWSVEVKKYNGIFDNIINGGVKNLEVDILVYIGNEIKEVRNKDFIEDVLKDVYIKEILNIIYDLIK